MDSFFFFFSFALAKATTTLVTFVDCVGYKQMALPIANKACYATKHGYSYRLKVTIENSRGITYRKPSVVAEALKDGEEGRVIWMDADVVVMDENRRIEEMVGGEEFVQMTDHNCNPNNGVVAISRSSEGRLFVDEWEKTCKRGQFPFTDQGCFFEQVIRTASNRSLVEECGLLRRRKTTMKCVVGIWDEVFGSFDATRDRGSNGIKLRRAEDGFNNHCCQPSKHQQTYCRWYDPPGWDERICFEPGMFAMHGRSGEKARSLGLPQANFETASLAAGNLSRCVLKRRQRIQQSVASVCSSRREQWIRV